MKSRRTILALFALLAVLCLAASGCATSTGPKPAAGAVAPPTSLWLRTELYMAVVDAEGWREFLANSVTPRFPDGFTVLEAYGQWRNARGEIQVLPSRILVILHPPIPQADAAVEAIRREFKKRFNQMSVLRATAPAQVAF